MILKEFENGSSVCVRASFKDVDGTLIDPTAVRVRHRNPAGVNVEKVYGVDAEVIKSAVGIYSIKIDANVEGVWFWKFWSTGVGKAAIEGGFRVKPSEFD